VIDCWRVQGVLGPGVLHVLGIRVLGGGQDKFIKLHSPTNYRTVHKIYYLYLDRSIDANTSS